MIAPPKTAISLSIEKQSSILHNLELVEYIPKKRIKALIKSDCLLLKWGDCPNYTQQFASVLYLNERTQVQEYLKKYDTKLGGVVCLYKKPAHLWGRSFPFKSMGITSMGKRTRNTLIEGLYYDIDLSSAQIKIVQNICKTQNPPIPCPMIDMYVADPKKIREDLGSHYNTKPKKIKSLMLRLCFFGTFQGWCNEEKVSAIEPNLFITAFTAELTDIAKKTKEVNHTLYECARHLKDGKTKKNKNYIGSFYALYLQEWETRIIGSLLSYFMNETTLMNHPTMETPLKVGIYEYDGLKLLKENVDKFEGGLSAVIDIAIQKIAEDTKFIMGLEAKEIEDFHDISEIINSIGDDEGEDLKLKELIANILSKFDDTGVIETIIEMNPNHYVFSKGAWFGWNGNKWEDNVRPLERAIMYDIRAYWDLLLKPFITKYPKTEELDTPNEKMLYAIPDGIIHKIEGFHKQHLRDNTQILKCLGRGKTLLADDALEFDINTELIGFDNGVFDLIENCFRPYRFDDYTTKSCGFNFRPLGSGMVYKKIVEEEVEEIVEGETIMVKKSVLKSFEVVEEDLTPEDKLSAEEINNVMTQIMPDPEIRNLLYTILSTCLSGKVIEKFFIFNGGGRNGKGVVMEFLEFCIGKGVYFQEISPIVLSESDKNKSSGGSNPEIASIHKMRCVCMKEPSKNSPLNNNVVKAFTGGNGVKARQNYSNNSNVLTMLTLIMECNKPPNFSEAPVGADADRVVDIYFPSHFGSEVELWDENTGIINHEYSLDPSIKSSIWRTRNRNMFMNILLTYLVDLRNKHNWNIDHFIPKSVKERSLVYLQKSHNIHNLFIDLFEPYDEIKKDEYRNAKYELSNNDWTLSAIANVIRKGNAFKNLSKKKQESDELKKDAFIEFFKTNKFYKNAVSYSTDTKQFTLKGWRKKIIEADEEEETHYY